jgi:hypothetical protein
VVKSLNNPAGEFVECHKEDFMAQKICKLVKKGLHTKNPKKLMSLVRDSRYLCASCGRTAAKKEALCKPEKT